MFTAKQWAFAGLLLSALLNSSTAAAAPACVDLFKPSQKQSLEARVKSTIKDIIQNERSSKFTDHFTYLATKEVLNRKFQNLLDEAGLSVRESWKGFEILPEGTHPLAKMTRSLNRMGVRVVISIDLWAKGAWGAFDVSSRTLFVDYNTVATGKVDLTMPHEIRHAYNERRSHFSEGSYERVFQTKFIAFDMPNQRLPGMKGLYEAYFTLDEILAHRQSAVLTLRNLQRNPLDEQMMEFAKKHGERLKQFADSGLSILTGLKKIVEAGNHKFTLSQEAGTDVVGVGIVVPHSRALLQELANDTVAASLLGLKAEISVLQSELPADFNKKSMQQLLLSKLDTTIAELEALHPSINEFFEATKAMEQASPARLAAAESALRRLSETIAQRRKIMQLAEQTLQ